MGSLKDPKTWIPHINPKDCSQKVCNIYCTKWCKYVILPSPPPPLSKDDLGGATTISPVVIVIIALIGSFFILIAYYVFISRLCSRNNTSVVLSRSRGGIEINQETREMGILMDGGEDDHSNHVPWVVLGKGLDEALIQSITMCKYKKGDGLVSCTDCSVCLGEFQEDESVRILPKCSHAFHVYCIDTWLKTHSNCPLCRANIVCFEVKDSTPISPPISAPPPPPPLPLPQMITSELGERDVRVEIREEGRMKIRRSKSMDSCLCQQTNQAEEMMARQEVVQFRGEARSSSSENVWEGNSMGLGTKRSYSSGRYMCLRMDG